MQGVKQFAKNMAQGYDEVHDFHVAHHDESPTIGLFTACAKRRLSDEAPTSPSRLSFKPTGFHPRARPPLRPAHSLVATPKAGVSLTAPKPTHVLGLGLTQTVSMRLVARPIMWFQVKLTEVSSASERCDKALKSAESGLARHVDDPKSLRAVLRSFREAKTEFYAAKDVVVFREMKDLLQEAWVSAQCRTSHEERFEMHRAETDSLIRDLSERIEALHEHILRQGLSLEAADEEIRALKQALGDVRGTENAKAQPNPLPQTPSASAKLATSSEQIARDMAIEPAYLALKRALRDEILEQFKQEFLLGTAQDVPNFAQRHKSSANVPKDALQQRFSQMRKLDEARLIHAPGGAPASSIASWDWV